MSRQFIATIYQHPKEPEIEGDYLLLCWEWVGLESDRPRDPAWKIRRWRRKAHERGRGGWERAHYSFDTGGYENFEPVAWVHLPTQRPQFDEDRQGPLPV